jgi:hypothetical protein
MTRDIYRPAEYALEPVTRAIEKLKSFQHGDLAILEVVACGEAAVPALRAMLQAPEPSGLYQTRVRTVEALARLNAHNVLITYLAQPHAIADPIAQVGEDAVINAAARAVAGRNDPGLFEVLKQLAQRPCLAGVIFALGVSGRAEAIPMLIAALSEDESRTTAENALRKCGPAAESGLVRAALPLPGNTGFESESRLRQRRSALKLLTEMNGSSRLGPHLRSFIHDNDTRIAITASTFAIEKGPENVRHDAVIRLVELYCASDWSARDDIERCLRANALVVRQAKSMSAELEFLTAHLSPAAGLVVRLFRKLAPV